MVIATQLENYKKLCNTFESNEIWRTLSKCKRPQLTRPCHSAPERIRMMASYPTLNHTRVATLKSIKSMLGARIIILLDSTTLNNSGIQIHGKLILHFVTMTIERVQGIPMMATHSTRYVPITLVKYPISMRNEGILAELVKNSSFYNKVRTKFIEVLEGNQYNDFKTILVSSNTKKPIIVDFDVEITLSLLSRTPFHNIETIKSMPQNPRGDPPKPPKRCYSSNCATNNTQF
jgi:hypothetical protein